MRRILIILLLFAGLFLLSAQEAVTHRLGIHFQVYGEPHEPDNPLYVNVLPLVSETTLGKYLTVKAGTILSLRISDGVTLGNLGFIAGLPFFPFGMNDRLEGFFIGPLVLGSCNVHTSEIVVSTALDAGYSFYIT